MALTDEEEKALKEKHQADLNALTQQVAEANAKAQEVDTLKAQPHHHRHRSQVRRHPPGGRLPQPAGRGRLR